MSKNLSPKTQLKGKLSRPRLDSKMNKRTRNHSEPLPLLSKTFSLNDFYYNPPKFDLLKIKNDFFKMEANSIAHNIFKKNINNFKKERSPFEISKSIAPEKINFFDKKIKIEEVKREDQKRANIIDMGKNLLYFDKDKIKKNKKNSQRKSIITDVYAQYFEEKNQNKLCNLQEFSNLLKIHEYQKNLKRLKEKKEKDLEMQKLILEFGREKKIWEKIDPNMIIKEKDKKIMQNPRKLKLTLLIVPKNFQKII